LLKHLAEVNCALGKKRQEMSTQNTTKNINRIWQKTGIFERIYKKGIWVARKSIRKKRN
jgi:hypothetical protein